MNLLEVFFRGGIIMYPILLCSLIVVYVALERYFTLRRARRDTGQFMLRVNGLIQRGDAASVAAFCSEKDVPVANVIRRGMAKHEQGSKRVREAVEDAARSEIYRLERRLPWLASLSGIAPMLGFLGTVMGMVGAFQRIQAMSGVVNPSDFAGSIWQALIAMVFGLSVGIVALTLYNYFVSRIARFVHEMEVTTTEFLDILERQEHETLRLESVGDRAVPPTFVFDDDQFFRKKG